MMNRRKFFQSTVLLASAGVAGRSQAQQKPCAPPSMRATGGGSTLPDCPTNDLNPAWLQGKELFAWVTLTGIGQTAGITPNPLPQGGTGVNSVTDAWGGGALRPNGSYYIIHGGGHGDYSGNEIYVLKLSDDAPAWRRMWGPTPNSQIIVGTNAAPAPYYADGNPASIHTFYDLQWNAARDWLMRMHGGSYKEPSGGSGDVSSWAWGSTNWNRAAGSSTSAGYHPNNPTGYAGGVASAPNGDVYCWTNTRRVIWRNASNSFQVITEFENYQLEEAPLVYDTTRNVLWGIGGPNVATGKIRKWDAATNASSEPTVTGPTDALAICTRRALGGAYDPVNDCVWLCDKSTVYKFNPANMTLSVQPTSGTLQTTTVPGPYNRWQYVPELNGIVYQPNWSSPTFFLRVS